MIKTIVIEITPEGKIKAEGVGFKGPECDKALEEIEKLFGKASETRHKPEYKHQVKVGKVKA